MELTGLTRTTTPLLGRERECAEIDRVLDSATAGESAALIVRGEAGIGKTALLDYAAERASEMLVLCATGVEAESDLAFAGLYGLVRPITGFLGQLPAPQAEALQGALGLGPSSGADRFLISAAVLSLLAAAAEDRPVLCVIDDGQWLDAPSADALVFAARRLRADRVAILFGAREGEPRRFEAAGLPELLLAGLDDGSAAEVLAVRAGEAAPAVRSRLLAEAHGNPLALIELPAGLTDAQLAGVAPLPETIPLTPRLQAVFRQRIERLPEESQVALLIAAADDTGEVTIVLGAAAELGLDRHALDPAEAAGLIRAVASQLAFRHPLVRSALYEAATVGRRQDVHAALAAVLTGEEHADRRVWHQAMATMTADEEVAAALEASARRAQIRAAHASAATAFLQSAELSGDDERRVNRVAAAAHAAWNAGQPDRARAAIARALPAASGELRAQLLHLSGLIEARTGSLRDAYAILLEGAEASGDPSLALEMLFEAAEAATFSGDLDHVVELGRRVAQIPVATDGDRFKLTALTAFARLFGGDHEAATALFNEALERADGLDDPRALLWAADVASVGQELGTGLPFASRAVELARGQGRLALLHEALRRQTMELVWNSQFELAYAAAHEGYRLSLDIGYGSGSHLANMAIVEAAFGREGDARRHAEEALVLGQRRGSAYLVSTAVWTLGFIELTAGRATEAANRLLGLTSFERSDANPIISLPAIPDAVEAALRAGRRGEAADRLELFRSWEAQSPSKSRHALLARCEALLRERDPDEGFGEAIALADALPPFQRARTELLYGEWLRRERRRQDARVHLRAALELFRSLGTVPFAERAEAELRATGETARKRDPSTLDELTPQELQIAGMVAEGMTNKEIASQLYLSPRTIDYHLRKVFSKLGIASRTELVRQGLPARKPA